MPRGKAAAERKHAKRRMIQRFGIPVGDDTLRRAVQTIQSGGSKPIRKQSERVSLHELTLNGFLVRVAYDKRTKEIITILRPGEENQY